MNSKTPHVDPDFRDQLKKDMIKIAEDVEAPRRLAPQNLDELLDLRPPRLRQKRMPIFRFAGVAACFALLVALVLTLNQGLFTSSPSTGGDAGTTVEGNAESSIAITTSPDSDQTAGGMGADSATKRGDDPYLTLLEDVVANTAAYQDPEVLSQLPIDQYMLEAGNAGNGAINGVESAAMIAADETFVYIALDHSVDVYTAADLTLVNSVPYASETVQAVYAVDGLLTVVASSSGQAASGVGPYVRVETLELPASGEFRLQRRQFVQEGWYLSSAIHTQDSAYAGNITLVTQKQIDIRTLAAGITDDQIGSYLPRTSNSQTTGAEGLTPLDISLIHVPDKYNTMPRYTIVSMIDAADASHDAQSFAVLGEAYHVYIGGEGTYIANKLPLTGQTALSRVEFWGGYPFYNECVVEGQLLNTGAIREELNMCKAVMTTDDGRSAYYNTFSIVMYPLKTIDIEPQGERIGNIVMVEDYLYVLPDHEDNPIRIYNTSSNSASVIGEASSDTLTGTIVRAYGDIYLGLDNDDGPLVVSTYDLRTKEEPRVAQSQSLGQPGGSPAFTDYRTFKSDEDGSGYIFVPVVLSNYKNADTAGLFAFSVSRTGGLKLEFEMRDETPIHAFTIYDGVLYRVTEQHVKAVDLTSRKEVASCEFESSEPDEPLP